MKLYFRNEESEYCHPKEYFLDEMKDAGIAEMEVYEAVRDEIKDVFWCKAVGDCGVTGNCGRQCEDYEPRNGKNGCCKYFTKKLYTLGNKVIYKKEERK